MNSQKVIASRLAMGPGSKQILVKAQSTAPSRLLLRRVTQLLRRTKKLTLKPVITNLKPKSVKVVARISRRPNCTLGTFRDLEISEYLGASKQQALEVL